MKATIAIAAAIALLGVSPAYAGSYVTLPVPNPVTPTSRATPVAGSQNQAADQLLIPSGPALGNGNYAFPSTLTLLASRNTEVFLRTTDIGSFQDYVFRDTTDNKLVFGSRLTLGVRVDGSTFNSAGAEVNDIFRSGFTGYSVAAAWAFKSDQDLRLYLASRSATGLLQGAQLYSPDVVDLRSDINMNEGNPWSGLFLLKTDAPSYTTLVDAIRIRQGGEEGQTVTNFSFTGFAPAAAVPEPSAWMMMLAGLGIMGIVVRRRLRS